MNAPLGLISRESRRGRQIKGETLFGIGAELSAWLTLIIQHDGQQEIDINRLITLVSAHWRRGISKLDEDWKLADSNFEKFVRRLVEIAGLPMAGALPSAPLDAFYSGNQFAQGEIKVLLGELGKDASTGEEVTWSLNGRGHGPHSAIMGITGSGKTVMAATMLRAIRDQAPIPLLAFDFKGDLANFTSTNGQPSLGQAFEAQEIEPPRTPIPIDMLALADNDEISISQAAERFRESFSRIGSNLGARQRGYVLDAAKKALTSSINSQTSCELHHIRDRLIEVYADASAIEDGALTTMKELCQYPLFHPDLTPDQFFQGSWIIKLPPALSQDSKLIVINLMLDALDQYLNSLVDTDLNPDGSRGVRILCMIDEAHQILKTKLPSLSRLIRMSRSKGGSVMLVSQTPDDFLGQEDEFLANMELVAAFTTTANPRAVTRVLGRGANLATLRRGECYARVGNSLRKVKAWNSDENQ